MARIVDKLVLFAICSVLLLAGAGFVRPVIVLLSALTLAEVTLCLASRKAVGAVFVGFMVLCVAEPSYLCFLPLMLYDCCWHSMWWGVCSVFLILIVPNDYEMWKTCVWIICIAMSFLFAYRTKKFNGFQRDFIRLRDSSVELNMSLREKNRELMEQQEYGIHLATLSERNRIAREIHDNVGHMLSRCILQVGALMTVHKEEPVHAQLASVNDTLNQAMTSIRESVHDLHYNAIDLKQAVLEATKEMNGKYQIHFEYDMTSDVPNQVKYCFISSVKEALSNIVKHSNADKVTIVLREHPAFYQMLVEDNGTVACEGKEPGIGLSNMQERAGALGGTLHVQNENGFRIMMSIRKGGG